MPAAAQDTSLGYGQGAIDMLDECNPHDYHCWDLGCVLPRVPARIVRTGVDVSRGSKTACTVQPADMIAVAKLLDAIYESSREGKRVVVEV